MKENDIVKLLSIIHNNSCRKCSINCCKSIRLCVPRPCCELIRSTDKDIQSKITSNIISYFNDHKEYFNLFIELFSNEELLNEMYSNKDVE